MHLAESRVECHVGERASTVVPQQRVRVPAFRTQPRAAQDQQVHVAVVVVVGLDHVQTAVQSEQTGFGGAFGERAVPVVSEVADLSRVSHVETTMSR